MSEVTINDNETLGSALAQLMMAGDIQPGQEPSYQICRTIYLYHPLGAKMAASPIMMAQSQQRQISIANSPEERVRKAFQEKWTELGCDRAILNQKTQSRVYGVATLALVILDEQPNTALDYKHLPKKKIALSTFDPLNTAGSMVLDQNPNSFYFQKVQNVAVQGTVYHQSRRIVTMNEEPFYIAYTGSAFGYVGRSVYQRALVPLKTFIQTMITDDLIVIKSGVIVAKLKPQGAIATQAMKMFMSVKRLVIKLARTGNVINVSAPDESIETLDMKNLEAPYTLARSNCLKNAATAADMPAKLLENETMVEGFGEGEEDAKHIAKYIDRVRVEMGPEYRFLDNVTQYSAWDEAFFKTIQAEFPDPYANMDHQEAFYRWKNSFVATWPNLLTEPDSEKSKSESVKFDNLLKAVAQLAPMLDPVNKAKVVQWCVDNLNDAKTLFVTPLLLDYDALAEHAEKLAESADKMLLDGGEDDEGDTDDTKADSMVFTRRRDGAGGGFVAKQRTLETVMRGLNGNGHA